MKKIALPLIAIMSTSIILTGCGNDKDEVGSINDSKHKQEEQKEKDSAKQQNNKAKNDKKQSEKKQDKKATTTLDDAINEADRLHDFVVEDSTFYDNLRSTLKSNGVKLADNYYLPYLEDVRQPNDEQNTTFAGIIVDKKVDKKKDSAIITYKVKSGMSANHTKDGDYVEPDKLGDIIKDKLKNDKKYKDKVATVKYEVKMNKDRTATIKKLTKGDWSMTK